MRNNKLGIPGAEIVWICNVWPQNSFVKKAHLTWLPLDIFFHEWRRPLDKAIIIVTQCKYINMRIYPSLSADKDIRPHKCMNGPGLAFLPACLPLSLQRPTLQRRALHYQQATLITTPGVFSINPKSHTMRRVGDKVRETISPDIHHGKTHQSCCQSQWSGLVWDLWEIMMAWK